MKCACGLAAKLRQRILKLRSLLHRVDQVGLGRCQFHSCAQKVDVSGRSASNAPFLDLLGIAPNLDGSPKHCDRGIRGAQRKVVCRDLGRQAQLDSVSVGQRGLGVGSRLSMGMRYAAKRINLVTYPKGHLIIAECVGKRLPRKTARKSGAKSSADQSRRGHGSGIGRALTRDVKWSGDLWIKICPGHPHPSTSLGDLGNCALQILIGGERLLLQLVQGTIAENGPP